MTSWLVARGTSFLSPSADSLFLREEGFKSWSQTCKWWLKCVMHCYWEHTSGAPSFVDDFSKRPSWTHMQTLFNYGQWQYCPSTNCTGLVSVHLSGRLHMFMKGDCLSNVLIKCWTNTSHCVGFQKLPSWNPGSLLMGECWRKYREVIAKHSAMLIT